MTTKRIEKILVPIALSREGNIAIDQAVSFNNVFGSKLIIINIIPEDKLIRRLLNGGKTSVALEKAHHQLEKFVKKHFKGKIPDFVNLQVRQGNLVPTIFRHRKIFHHN